MKTYNAALQAQLDAYLSEQSGLPQSKAAAMIGVSPTALSQYRNSKYPGDVEAVESKIEEFLRTRSAAAQAEAEKAPYLSAGYVPTSVSEDVYKAIQYCQLERGIVVLHGDAGIGKTRGAARFVQDNPANAIYIRCTPVGGTLTAMLRQLGTALKLPATRNRLELSMAIHDRLKGTDKVIIIDEAQNLCWGVQRGFEGVYADVSDAKYPEEENRGAALLDAAETEAAVSLPLTIEEAS